MVRRELVWPVVCSVVAVDMRNSCVWELVFKAVEMRFSWGHSERSAGMLTAPRPRGIFRETQTIPESANTSTHYRRDEKSHADGNLTGQIRRRISSCVLLPVVL